ncbi:MAG: efflux RND transporter periplasmic adaptor subunit [Acidobacteriota bacterium]
MKSWLALAGVVVLGAVLFLTFGAAAGPEIPTQRLERRDFVRRVPAEGYLRATQSNALKVPSTIQGPVRIAWVTEDGSRVAAGEPVVRFDPSDFEERMTQARDDLDRLGFERRSEDSTSQAELANLDRDAEVARLELDSAERFQKRDEQLFSRTEIIESEIDGDLARHRQRHAESSKADRAKLSRTQLDLLGIEQRQANLRLATAESSLEDLEIVSPQDGIVVLKTDWRGNPPRTGDTTWAGQPLAEIPNLAEMEAEVWVLEADAGGLAAGQAASLVVEAHPEVRHGAVVKSVDSVAKPRRRGSPVQYFSVVLTLEETDPAVMKPGQRVRAELLVEERPDALVVPRQAIFERDGEFVVFARQGAGFEPRSVVMATTFLGQSVVEGLDEGTEIALVDPAASSSSASSQEAAPPSAAEGVLAP